MTLRHLAALLVAISLGTGGTASGYSGRGAFGPVTPLESLTGHWQDEASPSFVLGLEGSQILIADNGRILDAATILRPTSQGLLVCQAGEEARLQIRRAGEKIELFDSREGRTRRLIRLDSKPASLSLSLPLPEPVLLEEERILAIQREIRLRFQSEQSLFKSHVRGEEEPLPWQQQASEETAPALPEGINFLALERFGNNG
jgi:hypothetical protein